MSIKVRKFLSKNISKIDCQVSLYAPLVVAINYKTGKSLRGIENAEVIYIYNYAFLNNKG